MNKAEIISRHAQALKGQVGTSLAIDECEDIVASMFYEAINYTRCCMGEAELKAKLEEQLEDIRQWLIDEDFKGLAERI